MSVQPQRGVGLAFLFVGLGLLTGAGYAWKSTSDRNARALRAPGKVTALERSGSVYHPRVEFFTRSEQRIEFRGAVGSSPPSYQVGEKVEVLYERDAPEKARIDSFVENGLLALILGLHRDDLHAAGIAVHLRSHQGMASAPHRPLRRQPLTVISE